MGGDVLDEVRAERKRQDEKWGEQNWLDGTRSAWWQEFGIRADLAREICDRAYANGRSCTFAQILTEEFCEAMEAEGADLRKELVQVAAVAVCWVEAIDRRLGRLAKPPSGAAAGFPASTEKLVGSGSAASSEGHE